MHDRLRLLAAVLPFIIGLAMLRLSRRRPVRRAAFDIGSGGTKMLIADVDPATGALVARPIFEIDRPIPFKADQQAHGRLSEAIQAHGLDALRQMLDRARELGALEACAIATEVFRVAPNGDDYLRRVHAALGLRVLVVTQPLEARLGLATAEGLASCCDNGGGQVTSWDSGGGSFQITARAAGPSSTGPLRIAKLRTYTGRVGTSPAFKALVTQVTHPRLLFTLVSCVVNGPSRCGLQRRYPRAPLLLAGAGAGVRGRRQPEPRRARGGQGTG